MATRNKIDKNTVIEMREAREQGMTNKEIAELLGLSSDCVYKHIGPQPDGLRASYGYYKRRKDAVPHEIAVQPYLKPLMLTFKSENYVRLLDHQRGVVQFGDSPDQITKSRAVEIIKALNEVMPYLRDEEGEAEE